MSVDTNKPKKVVMMQGGLPCLGVGPRPPKEITLSEEPKPTEREIVAALAGELMSAAVRVSMSAVPDLFVNYHPHVQCLDIDIYIDGWRSGMSCGDLPEEHRGKVYVDEDDSAEKIHCLIMKVEALGEVSG